MTKPKAFADDKYNIAKIMIYVYDGVENTVGKGINTGYQHFSPFPTVFSKFFSFRVVKDWDCVGRFYEKQQLI